MCLRKRINKSGCPDTGKLSQDSNPSKISRGGSDMTSKRFYIKTFGCQMNERDSEAVAGLFLEKGYTLAFSPEEADIVLVNTCSVREHAEQRAISYLGSLKKVTSHQSSVTSEKIRNTCYPIRDTKIIGLIGCMARSRGKEIFKRAPHVDLICGPGSFERIPEYIKKIMKEGVRIIDLEDKLRNEDFYHAPFREEKDHAYVVISTGCSNYCSYCIVPFVRGPLRLRAPGDIIDEVKRNVELAINKITLLGQNVNDYYFKFQIPNSKFQIVNFVDLLKMVEGVRGVQEIDFVTSHPKNTSKELFCLMAKSKKIKKHLHLPFQSGSNRILKLMGRGYSREKYLSLINDYKRIVAGTLSTDVIVGFPSETEKDFLQTRDILDKVKFDYAYIFKYSLRPGAKAAQITDDIGIDEKKMRHNILLQLQKKISLDRKSVV